MQFALTDEQEMIVSTVRRIVEEEVYPHENDVKHSGEARPEDTQRIKRETIEFGFDACNSPESAGRAVGQAR